MKRTSINLQLLASALLSGCGGEIAEVSQTLARPVTVIELHETTPPPGRLIPGVVTPYRQTPVPFEVTGRVKRLIDIGDDVEGEQVDREGNVVQAGTVLAELDPAPLQRALNQAKQRLASARRQLDAQEVQLDTVLPAQIDSARSSAAAAELSAKYANDEVKALESAVQLAETTLERNRSLLPTGAVSDITVRQSETDLQTQKSRLAQSLTLVSTREREHDAALAAIAELNGSVSFQEASNEAQAASIKELEEAVLDAESNLENCVLRAPFPGRVTQLHVGEGSFIQAGSAVVTLTMMNPIEVIISVSAGVEEQLVVGADALIYPMNGKAADLEQRVRASIYQKRGVADASTRTFEVGLIAPNKRRVVRGEQDGLPSVPYVIPIFENPLDLPGPDGMYTIAEAVGGTSPDNWVLKVRELSQGSRSAETLQGTLEATRVPVQVSDRTIQVASFSLVELSGTEDLSPGDLLVPMPMAEHESGFIVDDNRWLLRPGDLVQVSVDHGELLPGFYAPVQTIRELNGKTTIFVVDANDTAQAIEVEVKESAGELRRIVSPELEAGVLIVSKGAHFLQNGDTVIRTGAAQ